MKMNLLSRCVAAITILMMVMITAACKASGPVQATEPPERPQVTASPIKVAPPDASRFAGYSLRLKPAVGPVVILQEPIGAQLVMDAFSSDRLHVQDAICKFGNKLEVLDPSGAAKYKFTLASDGQKLLKSEDGRVFHMPEYIYYLMEESLWSYGGSLMESTLKWQPDKGTALLELELPRLVDTAMLPAFGYASAYFSTYKIYGVNTSERDVARVYLLLTYAGYDILSTSFTPNFMYTTPVTLIFKKMNNVWKLTGFKQPPVTKEKKDLYANIRTIFPYDYMDAVLDDLKDTSGQVNDIARQATEYLNDMGISGLTVDS